MTKHLSKALPINTITFEIQISTYELRGNTNIQTIALNQVNQNPSLRGFLFLLRAAPTHMEIPRLVPRLGTTPVPAGLLHRHNNKGSKSCPKPTPQLTATLDP